MHLLLFITGVSQGALAVRNPPAKAAHWEPRVRSLVGKIPWMGSPKGDALQCSCLEHPMDRGIRGVTESDTIEPLNTSRFAKGIPALVYIYLRSPCSLIYILLDGPQSSPVAAAGTENRSSRGP